LADALPVAITVDGTTYTSATTYDAASRISTATYPSGFAVKYLYTTLGYTSQLADNTTGNVFWTANKRDASLHLTQQTAGNGVVTNQSFDANTGRLTAILAGTAGAVENFSYTYDTLGNLTGRTDGAQNLSETFVYDSLNRLTSSTITGSPANPTAKSFQYDALGNITVKSDVGNYAYPAPGAAEPHAVLSISGGEISATFTYDANGNQTGGLGRTIGYTSFNKPNSISQGTVNVAFTHDTEHQRLKKLDTNGGVLTTTTYLAAGPLYVEKVVGSGGASVIWNEYLSIGGEMVGVRFNNTTGNTVSTRYFHKDHLGSVATLTDENGLVVQRLSYDPWGKQRDPSTWADDPSGNLATQDQTTRGFTSQEQLADVGLVHMNGCVYDPMLGRFMSPDPIVADPYNSQTLNRYAYVYDNPLTFTDPSGYCGFFCSIGRAFRAVFLAPIHLAQAILKAVPIFGTIVQIAATAVAAYFCGPCAIGVAAATASFNAGVTSGKIGVALKAGLIAGATAAAFYGVGELTTPVVDEVPPIAGGPAFQTSGEIQFGSGNFFANVAGHAAVGCASAAASGGECGPGALSAGVTAFAGPVINHAGFAAGLVANTVLGGVASVAGGGKFENGAITGAFGYLFNSYAHQCQFGICRPGDLLTEGGGSYAGGGGYITPGALGTAIGVGIGSYVSGIVNSVGDGIGNIYDNVVHGNSLDSQRQTYVYQLVDQTTNEVLKYGITSEPNPVDRYTAAEYAATNSQMQVLGSFSNRAYARIYELGLNGSYVIQNGRFPPLTSRF
jgi:RHS repeat-associated protein